ncbi:hypothetical protein HDU98_006413 [Podochytrium sp. JEL0797]|nr:hypothetical protein HDU98_006413 [Podochytrium sp. JEL0797]
MQNNAQDLDSPSLASLRESFDAQGGASQTLLGTTSTPLQYTPVQASSAIVNTRSLGQPTSAGGGAGSGRGASPAPSHFTCLWAVRPNSPCLQAFTDPDEFYAHIAELHVGRKSMGNLTLNCLWMGCGHGDRPFSKRDHIVSHCRAHVPFKANVCVDCNAQFKWPQDLKKHCLKQNHTFVDPSVRSDRPGPSTLVVDQETGTPMMREGPRLTGGTRRLGRGRGGGVAQYVGTSRNNSAAVSEAGTARDSVDGLLALGGKQQGGEMGYRQPTVMQQQQYSNQGLPYSQQQPFTTHQSQQEFQQRQFDQFQQQQQFDLDQMRQQQIQNQQQQMFSRSYPTYPGTGGPNIQLDVPTPPTAPFIPQSPAFVNVQRQTLTLQHLLNSNPNTPMPNQPMANYHPSPSFLNPNTAFKVPGGMGSFTPGPPPAMQTPQFAYSGEVGVGRTQSLDMVQQQHPLLVPSPNFNHGSFAAGGRSPLVHATGGRKPHPYRVSTGGGVNNGMFSPVPPAFSGMEAGLAGASPFGKRSEGVLLGRQMQERNFLRQQSLQQQQQGVVAPQTPQQFLEGFGITSVAGQGAGGGGGGVMAGFASPMIGGGFGMRDVEADILADVDGLLAGGILGEEVVSTPTVVNGAGFGEGLLSQAYGMIGGDFAGGEFGKAGVDDLF